jgi:hypothetical protein
VVVLFVDIGGIVTGPYTHSCKTVASENIYISGAPNSGIQYKRRRRRYHDISRWYAFSKTSLQFTLG